MSAPAPLHSSLVDPYLPFMIETLTKFPTLTASVSFRSAATVKDFKAASPGYAYELLRLLDTTSFNAGSAIPSLNRNHIHGLPYVLPDRRSMELFESIALPLHRRSRENAQQAQTLAILRDTLLPRLISGQLRLPEAQALLEAGP